MGLVRSKWVDGVYILKEKLKWLKGALKSWNKE
ncbi:hypothetical protein A2U01_0027626, partial [Trifolium medium]|nr:hypothetical protein [Trifolium medium]